MVFLPADSHTLLCHRSALPRRYRQTGLRPLSPLRLDVARPASCLSCIGYRLCHHPHPRGLSYSLPLSRLVARPFQRDNRGVWTTICFIADSGAYLCLPSRPLMRLPAHLSLYAALCYTRSGAFLRPFLVAAISRSPACRSSNVPPPSPPPKPPPTRP